MLTAKELKEILQVLQEFNVELFKTAELELHCNFQKPVQEKPKKVPFTGFPEAKYANSLRTPEITPEELIVFGLNGVDPKKR
jgi:hypothetical protein